MSKPLTGVRILDLTHMLSGPYGGMILADLGAETIKVEPLAGEGTRKLLASDPNNSVDGMGAYFLTLNRNKKSVAIDLKDPEGLALFYQLVAKSDIVLSNFGPGVPERLKIDFDSLKSHNPKIITCAISGFGSDGPSHKRPAFDQVAQAIGGGMSITGTDADHPMRAGIPIGDLGGGMFGVMGVLAALYERERSGLGQHVDISMLDVQVSLLNYMATMHLLSGIDPEPIGNAHFVHVPYNTFRCSDGFIVIAVITDNFWQNLKEVVQVAAFDNPEYDTQPARLRDAGFINPAFTADIDSIPSRSATYSQFQPKVTWSWAASDDINVYASWGVGFRSGGFNSIGSEALIDFWYGDTCPFFLPTCGDPGIAVDAQLNVKDEYAKEVSTSYELGAKMQFMDNRLRVNAAVFDTTVDDSQFFEFFAGPFGLMRVVTTIDELNIRGFEADFNAVVTENFSLFGGVGLIDSEIKQNINRPLSVGNEAPQAPDRTYNLGAEFDTEVATGINLVARFDWQYIGETWFHTMQGEESPTVWNLFYGPGNSQNFSKAKRDAYNTLNARLSLSGEQWDVTLWGKNITDEEYLEEVIQAPEFGGSFIHPGARDSYGVDFSYRF